MDEKRLKEMPLYEKAKEIFNMVDRITGLIPKDNVFLSSVGEIMYADAIQLAPKIAGAEAGGLYDLKMENAALIRRKARDIYVQCNNFLIEDFKEIEFLNLLRDEIDEFRKLFAAWVQTFDQWNYIIDRWGLFNPPGVKYDDKDPDEDLPFNNPFDNSEDF
ncbi:MAG TPA: hypothetical protein VFM70_08000 [Salinimicrobium sp.]|nr:hypothetical protein [Salinimicrobium sp.]